MRILVFVLAFANLSFFAWSRGYLGGGESVTRAGEPLYAERIRIVSNDLPPKESEAHKEELPSLLLAEQLQKEICVALGEVPQAEADAIERLFAEKLPDFKLSRALAPGVGYWVLIPPFKTRREAEDRVTELKTQGVREYYIMPEGDGFAISLGLFSTQAAAESTLAALRGKKVRSVRLVERPRKITQIEIRGPELQSAEMRQALIAGSLRPERGAMSFTVGLTGGIGSGKSTVARLFAAQGAFIVDTDAIAHELTAAQGDAMPALVRAFGEALRQPDGSLDRVAMRRLCFSDPSQRERLEAILHPLIRSEALARCRGAERVPYVLLVVPLLIESGAYREQADRILVIDCDEARQIERVMARSALSEQEVRSIMATQASRVERLAAADDILSNDGSRDALQAGVLALHQRYLELATRQDFFSLQ